MDKNELQSMDLGETDVKNRETSPQTKLIENFRNEFSIRFKSEGELSLKRLIFAPKFKNHLLA